MQHYRICRSLRLSHEKELDLAKPSVLYFVWVRGKKASFWTHARWHKALGLEITTRQFQSLRYWVLQPSLKFSCLSGSQAHHKRKLKGEGMIKEVKKGCMIFSYISTSPIIVWIRVLSKHDTFSFSHWYTMYCMKKNLAELLDIGREIQFHTHPVFPLGLLAHFVAAWFTLKTHKS